MSDLERSMCGGKIPRLNVGKADLRGVRTLRRERAVAAFIVLVCAAMVSVSAHSQDIGQSSDNGPATAPATQNVTRTFGFFIPAQSLTNALEAYSATTGIQLLYSSRLTEGRMSSPVVGTMSADAALQVLLDGTYLVPIKTAHDIVTLMLGFQNIELASSPPIRAPMLQLSTLQVEAPSARDHRLYAMTVRYAIQCALQRDGAVRQSNYRIDFNVWVSQTGSIRRFEFLAATGDSDIDDTILNIVTKVAIGQSPPEDLPQPVHVSILANGAG